MGNAYLGKKEYDKAIEAYQKAIEINPQKDKVYYNMGFAYAKLKEPEKMIEAWEKAFELNPNRLNLGQRFFLWLYKKF